MPYNIIKVGSRFKVQDDKGRFYSKKGLTKAQARQQQKALYAAENRKIRLVAGGFGISKDGKVILIGNGWFTDALTFLKNKALKGVRSIQNFVVRPEPIAAAAQATSQLTRKDYPPKARAVLAKYGQGHVIEILVRREPVKTYVNAALNFITLGKWDEVRKRFNYDKLYHLSLVTKLAMPNGDMAFVMVEKNQVINITDDVKTKEGMEYYKVPVAAGLTLQNMMDKAAAAVGPSFFEYDAFNNNCQMFIKAILDANGLNTPQVNGFIMQDVSSILQGLPSFVSPFARLITNVAGLADLAIEGRGEGSSTPDYTGYYTDASGRSKFIFDGQQPRNVGFYFRVNHGEPGGGEWIWTGAPSYAPWMSSWSPEQIQASLKMKNDEAKRFGPPKVVDPRTPEQKHADEELKQWYEEHPEDDPANYDNADEYRYGDNPLITFTPENPGPVDSTTGAKAVSARKMRDGSYEIKYDNGSVEFTPGVTDQWVRDNQGMAFDRAEYLNDVVPERAKQLDADIKKKQEENWNNRSGFDKFFSNVTDGLVNVADFASNLSLPGITGFAGDVYQTFRPGTREENEAEARQNAVENYANNEFAKRGDYVDFRNDSKYSNLFKNDQTLDDPRAITRSVLERVSDGSVFDPTGKKAAAEEATASATGQEGGAVSKPSRAFAKQLKEVGITPAQYLGEARRRAAEAGYDPADLIYSDNDENKLMMKDEEGRPTHFGRVGYGDYLLWQVMEARGKARRGQAEMKRRVFHASHSKIRGDWRRDPFSANNLALLVIW
jgi:hypothetical protein